ncbi:unnamed protein product [Effrenium voratum]|nr:unnamed protein product [Effrenium voratum]
MLLFFLNVLPGVHFDLHLSKEHHIESTSVWSSVFGGAGTILTMACWRCTTAVFLDRICISETPDLKRDAIFSLAGILDKSESMLVLWDASFAERLWCVFEIAAFLKSKEKRDRTLVIYPTLTGPVSFAAYAMATIGFIPLVVVLSIHYHPQTAFPYTWYITGFVATVTAGTYAMCHVMRGLYRSIEVMQRQLLSLEVAQLKCTCCSTGTCARSGVCDKRVISACIAIWFGSTDDFVGYIRSTVVDVISAQLELNAFNVAWSVAMICPSMWGIFDMMQHACRVPHPNWLLMTVFLYLLLSTLLMCPVFVSWMKFLAYHLRHESRSRCGEVLTNSLMILCQMPVMVFGTGAYMTGNVFLTRHNETVVVMAMVAFLVPGWALMWFLYRRGNSGYLSRFISQQRLAQQGPNG